MSFFVNTYAWAGCLIIGAALNIFVAWSDDLHTSRRGMLVFQTTLWSCFIVGVLAYVGFSSFS